MTVAVRSEPPRPRVAIAPVFCPRPRKPLTSRHRGLALPERQRRRDVGVRLVRGAADTRVRRHEPELVERVVLLRPDAHRAQVRGEDPGGPRHRRSLPRVRVCGVLSSRCALRAHLLHLVERACLTSSRVFASMCVCVCVTRGCVANRGVNNSGSRENSPQHVSARRRPRCTVQAAERTGGPRRRWLGQRRPWHPNYDRACARRPPPGRRRSRCRRAARARPRAEGRERRSSRPREHGRRGGGSDANVRWARTATRRGPASRRGDARRESARTGAS